MNHSTELQHRQAAGEVREAIRSLKRAAKFEGDLELCGHIADLLDDAGYVVEKLKELAAAAAQESTAGHTSRN